MNKVMVLKGMLILLALAFIVVQIMGLELHGAGLKALTLLGLTGLYLLAVKEKSVYFIIFIILFTAGAILDFIAWMDTTNKIAANNFYYYTVNSFYILAYLSLIFKVVFRINFKKLVLKLPFHVIILLVLDVFSVIVITETTEKLLNPTQYLLEFVYNFVVMVLLSIALLNYIYRDDIKSMNLLLGSILIVFSEVIQMAYFYIENNNTLNVMCSVLLVAAFLFFYIHSTLKNNVPIMETSFDDDLKA